MGEKIPLLVGVDDLGVPQKQKRKRPPSRTDMDRLPKPVQNEHLPVKESDHIRNGSVDIIGKPAGGNGILKFANSLTFFGTPSFRARQRGPNMV